MLKKISHYIITIIIVILIWWLLSFMLNNSVFPRPLPVFMTFFAVQDKIQGHLLASLFRVILGVGTAILIGVPCGLILGMVKKLDHIMAPFVYLSYPVPKIAFLPVVLLILGLGDLSKIFLIAIIIFFQVVVTTRDAARSINPELILSVKSLGANNWQLFYRVIFPAALPGIFTAVRISTGTAIAVLFFTETFATFSGLGYFIMDAWTRVNYIEMFAGIVALSLLGLSLFLLIDILERVSCKWLYLDDSK